MGRSGSEQGRESIVPEHALRIVGVDQETNLPVHIALTLVLGEEEKFSGVKREDFAAPRGFLPPYSKPDRAEVRRSVLTEPVHFAAPRGFLPAFD
jgi:hypothetical protein